MSQPLPLFRSAQVCVLDSRCRHPRSGPAGARGGEPAHLALLRRGCFSYHLGRRSFLGDACTGLLHHPGADYRIGHPGEDGDDATLIELAPALADELFGRRPAERPELPLRPGTHLLHARVRAGLLQRSGDVLEKEELVLSLLEAVAGSPPLSRSSGPARRRVVDRARAFLGAHLPANLGLTAVAAEARCSPFHLMRLFRAETGRSLRAYRRELRVLAALPRVADGERDLAGLAAELGFAHHSHLTESFRRVLGVAPSRLRAELRGEARARS